MWADVRRICKVAEFTFRSLRTVAEHHPEAHFIAVSHSTQSHTDAWLKEVGGAGMVEVIVDSEREVYSRWGLGTSGWGHVLSLQGMWSVLKLGREQGIYNRPTQSGSRWQTAGHWAIDGEGTVVWGGPNTRADQALEKVDVEKAVGRANGKLG